MQKIETELANNFVFHWSMLKNLQKWRGRPFEAISKQEEGRSDAKEVTNVSTGSTVHYLPHESVVTFYKDTTKLRTINDTSAKNNESLEILKEVVHGSRVLLPVLCGMQLKYSVLNTLLLPPLEKPSFKHSIDASGTGSIKFWRSIDIAL